MRNPSGSLFAQSGQYQNGVSRQDSGGVAIPMEKSGAISLAGRLPEWQRRVQSRLLRSSVGFGEDQLLSEGSQLHNYHGGKDKNTS